jgi:spermidine synthase
MLSFALTIFTGAFLLFQVQPLIGKYILPWFGGSPNVWTTCMLFFQTLLLGGYAYAHFSTTRLKPKTQALLHLVLLVVALALMPITPSESWKAHLEGNPTIRVLLLLAATVGLPYLVLSATGPLLQSWFGQVRPGVSPYRLYALSNVGSLLALLSFPVYFEPNFTRQTMALQWTVGLAVFASACAWCALQVYRKSAAPAAAAPSAPVGDAGLAVPLPDRPVTRSDKFLWVFLPMVASLLLVATTNKLTQEVAVIPFLWVLPLALYLVSFIVCFDHERWYERVPYFGLTMLGAGVVAELLIAGVNAPIVQQVAGYGGALFLACMLCHGELFRLRPGPKHLTAYYLYISAGGALGSFFVAVVAPAIFSDYREIQIGWWLVAIVMLLLAVRDQSVGAMLAAALATLALAFVVPWLRSTQNHGLSFADELATYLGDFWIPGVFLALVLIGVFFDFRALRFRWRWSMIMGGYLGVIALGLGTVLLWQMANWDRAAAIHTSRNFYGVLKIYDYSPEKETDHYKLLVNGITTHGLQFAAPNQALWHTTYYGDTSGVGRAIALLPADRPRRLGFVGLGAGTLASFGRAGDQLRFYDINPAVVALSNEGTFTYLKRTPAHVDIALGDARLVMERELAAAEGRKDAPKFDLLALDAFSSDAIPVHLLTREALRIYLGLVADDGVIAIHISNRYLNLRPVVEGLAREVGLGVVTISDDSPKDWWVYRSTWMLVSRNQALLTNPKLLEGASEPEEDDGQRLIWTDDHASVFEILK